MCECFCYIRGYIFLESRVLGLAEQGKSGHCAHRFAGTLQRLSAWEGRFQFDSSETHEITSGRKPWWSADSCE